ncbi:penicillin-binding protein 2 [Trinickia caryophylli]|uniref:Peptidoglycan D,D-transpeptidase FtsI n=1 Tax=Trinickia caryophylli TaxID=28094 RepID=A0A1X7EAG4_TRICW|nr:penicillin-binding protein 2 [Trinickia caryophylli]PMS12971.1 penicillin-binding protein 2 [Trinickia caryophylli]TRX14735.1 penicillin-binding protein 2 [Trinickia caryophylli]WQE14579.1 penicillin-binding protein 2 [Trinickia caryophylli]SMF30518.1 peptidoglycan synthetase FtsI [Trinickia caryophylli]GLU32009.1 penicillin-binding protein [Trinickia caryophylli]
MPHDPKSRSAFAPFERNRVLTPRLPGWRSAVVVAALSAAFAVLAGRAFWVQVIEHDFHAAQGEKRHRVTMELDAMRGAIVDRHGALLAVSLTTYEIWAEPKRLDRAGRSALAELASALQLAPAELAQRFDTDRAYVLLKRHVDGPTAQRIARLGIPGISQAAASKRFYPEGESIAHVVGFTDIDDEGQEGIELAANAALTGEQGTREVIRDRLGRVVSELGGTMPPRNGETIRLTIDRRIQQLAYSQLKAALVEHRAQAGSAVVLDAHTGEILALANAPSFDPNQPHRRSGQALRNRALTDTFEPGSTIKPLLVALAIDSGVVNAATKVETGPGYYTIGPNTIHDTSNHGTITVFDALAKSSNVALAKIGLNMPAERIWRKYGEYGIGQPPALPFPGVAAGRLRPWQRWRPIEQATMSYGYGLSASLLQVAQTYTAFAGDGTIRPASLLALGSPQRSGEPPEARRVTTPATAAAIREMLGAAAEEGGTGRRARIDGYRIGGKTGTAWKHAGGAYVKGKYRALFVGLAPIGTPRIVVAVMIDEPSGRSYYGGAVAAPVFSSIASGTLQLLGVPPEV